MLQSIRLNYSQIRGLSLVELLVVIAIVAIMSLISIPYFTTAKNNLALKGVTRDIVSLLLVAKNRSIRGDNISIDISNSQKIELCSGSTGYCDSYNQILEIPEDITLETNLDAFYFERGFPKRPGGAFAAGTLTVTHSKTGKCFSIAVSKTGRVKIDECE